MSTTDELIRETKLAFLNHFNSFVDLLRSIITKSYPDPHKYKFSEYIERFGSEVVCEQVRDILEDLTSDSQVHRWIDQQDVSLRMKEKWKDEVPFMKLPILVCISLFVSRRQAFLSLHKLRCDADDLEKLQHLEDFDDFLEKLIDTICEPYPDPDDVNLCDFLFLFAKFASSSSTLLEKLDASVSVRRTLPWICRPSRTGYHTMWWREEEEYIKSSIVAFSTVLASQDVFSKCLPLLP